MELTSDMRKSNMQSSLDKVLVYQNSYQNIKMIRGETNLCKQVYRSSCGFTSTLDSDKSSKSKHYNM